MVSLDAWSFPRDTKVPTIEKLCASVLIALCILLALAMSLAGL